MKKIAIVVASIVIVLAFMIGGLYLMTFAGCQRPSAGPTVTGKFERVLDGFSAIYLVDLGDGKIAMVDAGNDKDGKALLAALAAKNKKPENVAAIFITHAHPDHIASIPLFPNAVVYVSKEEVPLAAGEANFRGPLNQIFGRRNKTPFKVGHPLEDGEKVTLGQVAFTAYHVPGHTPGSTAYLVEGALFLGDEATFHSDGTLTGPLWCFSDNAKEGSASLAHLGRRLEAEKAQVNFIVTAHTGTSAGLTALSNFSKTQP